MTLLPRVCPWSEIREFGEQVPARKVRSMLERLSEMTAPPSERIAPDAFNLGRWIVSIERVLKLVAGGDGAAVIRNVAKGLLDERALKLGSFGSAEAMPASKIIPVSSFETYPMAGFRV